ncbi:MAG: hypothetical protein KF782_04130 [Labilithrix sp.]|nr:hypothetical protein [Labilithrix sp.]
MIDRRWGWGPLVLALGLPAAAMSCGENEDCSVTSTCAVTADAGDPEAATVYPEVPPPAGCEPAADPEDAPACVDDAYALFVDSTAGDDVGAGSKTAPLRTLRAATDIDTLAGRPRIYACGAFEDAVRLPPGVSLVGGFDCGTWSYSGALVRVAPADPGIALRVDASSKDVVVSDVELVARDAVSDGASSIAAFVAGAKVTFRRVVARAGEGAAASPPPPLTNRRDGSLEGNGSTSADPGDAKRCACAKRGASTGGKGGALNTSGAPGSVEPPVQGAGGGGGDSSCTVGGRGADGRRGGAGGKRSPALGALSETGWAPGRGGDGGFGDPGAGGGGGGGNTGFGGGGGGCGGCGGHGGVGGPGGGASIALALYDADVKLVGGRFVASTAGAGVGGQAEAGQTGSLGSDACAQAARAVTARAAAPARAAPEASPPPWCVRAAFSSRTRPPSSSRGRAAPEAAPGSPAAATARRAAREKTGSSCSPPRPCSCSLDPLTAPPMLVLP